MSSDMACINFLRAEYRRDIQANWLALSRFVIVLPVRPMMWLAAIWIRAACDHVLHANSTLVDRVDLATPVSLSSQRLPAPRLLLPRSGLSRSDLVLWPLTDETSVRPNVGYMGEDRKCLKYGQIDALDPKQPSCRSNDRSRFGSSKTDRRRPDLAELVECYMAAIGAAYDRPPSGSPIECQLRGV